MSSHSDQEYAGSISVLHEVNDQEYRMTVSNPETGGLLFSWAMPLEVAMGMAEQMAETLLEHTRGG